MDSDDIQKYINQLMHQQNNQAIFEFEGYSPTEMHNLLYFAFDEVSPIRLRKLADAEYEKVPLFKQVVHLAGLIDKLGEIKLTTKGNLPTKIVTELYHHGFLRNEYLERRKITTYKEDDVMSVNLTRILIEQMGMTKKRHGKLSLTKAGKKLLDDKTELLRKLFLTFAKTFNWAYYDGYEVDHIGQFGYGFTLILLAKFGQEQRLDTFYAEKYFKAFPQLLIGVEPSYTSPIRYASRCYSLRTFDMFMAYLGLISIEEKGNWLDSEKYIQKTELFDSLIKVTPPVARYN